jgi:hypothetical protein
VSAERSRPHSGRTEQGGDGEPGHRVGERIAGPTSLTFSPGVDAKGRKCLEIQGLRPRATQSHP